MLKLASKRTPLEILHALKGGELEPQELSQDERRTCVEVLREEGYSLARVAALLGVSPTTVARDERKIAEVRAAEAPPILSKVLRAVQLERTADKVKSKAVEARDWALVWRVEKELQQLLSALLKEDDNRDEATGRLFLDQVDPETQRLLLEAVETELARRGEGP